MDKEERLHLRYLIAIAALLCAVMIGYNLFFTPEVSLTVVRNGEDLPVFSEDVITVPNEESQQPEGEVSEDISEEVSQEIVESSKEDSSAPQVSGLVNINTASAEELDSLPGIGPVLAERILAYREQIGTFTSLEQLKEVSGIGDKTFEDFKDSITLG